MKIFPLIVFAWAAVVSVGNSDELNEKFLQALKDRQYFDVALDYLAEMESSRLASDDFKKTIPFERAQTLIQSTSRIRDLVQLEKRLQEAEDLLTQSEADAADAELKARSQNYKGDLLFRRAKIYLGLGDNDRLTASEKETQYAQARQYLDKALETFGAARESYKQILDNYKLDSRDPESRLRLKRLRGIFTVVRVKLPQVLELYADTLASTDDNRNKFLTEAATNFEDLWMKYPNFPAGLDSCFYAARCKYKLNEPTEALSLLQRIFSLPNNSTLLNLKRKALVLAADCWAKTKPYPFDEVIANLEPISSKLTRRDQRNPDWQRVQVELARAYYEKSVDLNQTNPSDGRIKKFARDASKLIKSVARVPGTHRELARNLMSRWNLSTDVADSGDASPGPITNFAEAKQRGIDLINEIEGLNADISDAKRKQQQPGFDDQVDLPVMEARVRELSQQCIAVFERAIALRDASTTREDLNQIRYLQSVCYFVQRNFFEAALIGEFLVQRYASIAYSRQAGGIALRSYAAMHDKAEEGNREFEQLQLTRLSEKIINIWPGSAEAAEAASALTRMTLANSALSKKEVEKVESLMAAVGESSLERSALAVKLGTKLWFDYRKKKAAGEHSSEDLSMLLAKTTRHLSQGIQGFNLGNLKMEVAWGAVFLVNAHLENQDLDQALKQLEQSTIAPVDLVKDKNRVVLESNNYDLYVSETYKIAGKTYLAALSAFPSDSQWTDKALGIVRAMQLRASRSQSEAAQKQVLNMYQLIAVELERQLKKIADPDEQQQFVANLKQFLQTLQSESTDANTIIWTGKTMMNLADQFSEQGLAAESKPLYQSAVAALQRASKLGVKDAKILTELKRQQAIAKRGVGNFEPAFQELLELLRENPNNWRVQIDVAETLQKWGTIRKDKKILAKALAGGERSKDPKTKRVKNLVWGWSKLADALKTNSRFREAYFTAVMGAVVTRFEYGLIEENPKVVAAALKRLRFAKTKNPDLGGPNWKPRFEALERTIKKQMESMQVSARQ